jgi:hypothetical protein
MTRHFGVFQFKEGVSNEEISQCFSVMEGMVGKVAGLLDMEFGPYDSSEGLNAEFTHGFIMTFDSPESRDAYLPHPLHEKAKDYVVPKLERSVVFDFNI